MHLSAVESGMLGVPEHPRNLGVQKRGEAWFLLIAIYGAAFIGELTSSIIVLRILYSVLRIFANIFQPTKMRLFIVFVRKIGEICLRKTIWVEWSDIFLFMDRVCNITSSSCYCLCSVMVDDLTENFHSICNFNKSSQ